MKSRFVVLPIALCLSAAAQIEAPRIGCFVDSGGRLRTVRGVAGAFVIGAPEREQVAAVLCTDTLTIVKTAASLEVNGRVYAAPEGPAVIRRDGYVHYIAVDEWVRVTPLSIEAAGPPPPLEPAAMLDGTFVVIGGKRMEVPGRGVSVHELGPGWHRVVLEGGRHVAVSVSRERVYSLPEVAE